MGKGKRRKENVFLFRLLYLLVFNSIFQKLNQTEGMVLKDYAILLLFG